MKIVVERSVKDKLQDFFGYLKTRATDKDHEDNRDLIADFVDKVLVFEIKRLANEDKTIEEQIEIPDSVMVEPLLKAKSKLNSAFDEYLKKLGASEEIIESASDSDPEPVHESETEPVHESETESEPTSSVRNGNGHKKEKARDLNDNEKNYLRSEFISHNGQFIYKDCTKELKPQMGSDIAIWQVTGFISYLHREVAAGQLDLPNLPQYLDFLKDKYPSMAARYESQKFQQLRAQKTVAQSVTQPARPQFRAGMQKRS